jgi:regulator of nucleoside diphosphate kinase
MGSTMSIRNAVITQSNHTHLRGLLDSPVTQSLIDPQTLSVLRELINDALVVSDDRMPSTAITIGSVFVLRDSITGDEDVFTLVYPDEANIADGKLSVIAPVGAAILGRRVGQTARMRVLSGERCVRIQKILSQPVVEKCHLSSVGHFATPVERCSIAGSTESVSGTQSILRASGVNNK